MPINRYDDPLPPEPIREPSESAIGIRQEMVKDGIIPAKGKVRLSPELLREIVCRSDKNRPDSSGPDWKPLIDLSEELDVPFILYEGYSDWMPEEIEADYAFIDKVISDRIIFTMAQWAEKAKEDETLIPKKKQRHLKFRLLSGMIETESDDPAETLAMLNKAVAERTDLCPLISRADFFYDNGEPDKAIEELTQAVKEAKKDDVLDLISIYLHRAEYRIEKNLINEALDDLSAGFELSKKEIKKVPPRYINMVNEGLDDYLEDGLNDDYEDIIGRVGFMVEQGMPLAKLIADKKADHLTNQAKKKLAGLKKSILAVRQYMQF